MLKKYFENKRKQEEGRNIAIRERMITEKQLRQEIELAKLSKKIDAMREEQSRKLYELLK